MFMSPTVLNVRELSYSYHSLKGETPALSNITFSVKEGEFVAIVGPSGCGKSTLLSLIAGLLTPEDGIIERGNSRIGYMLQHDHLLEWRTIYKNVCLGLEINHCRTPENLEYIDSLLKEYDLEMFREKYPSELSGGMKQRAALIRTMALKPDLLLLDEPFSALDYQTRLQVSGDICTKILQAGKTAILITHDLSEAISLADRILVLTKRPASILDDIPVHLTVREAGPLAARQAPEYGNYFDRLWKELNHGTRC